MEGKVDIMGSDSAALTRDMKDRDIWSVEAGFAGAAGNLGVGVDADITIIGPRVERPVSIDVLNSAQDFTLWERLGVGRSIR